MRFGTTHWSWRSRGRRIRCTRAAVDVDAEEVLVAARAERQQRQHVSAYVGLNTLFDARPKPTPARRRRRRAATRRHPACRPRRTATRASGRSAGRGPSPSPSPSSPPAARPRREVERAEECDEEHPRARELHVVPADVLGVVRAQRAARRPLVARELEPSPKLERDALARRGERRVEVESSTTSSSVMKNSDAPPSAFATATGLPNPACGGVASEQP